MHKEQGTDSAADSTESNKVSFVSLGCPKALVDAEHIVTSLQEQGFEVVPEDDAEASVVVVNTCGFIDAAKQESIDAITRAYDESRKVVVTGCMGADPTELRQRFSELDAISGPAQVAPVVGAVQTFLPDVTSTNANDRPYGDSAFHLDWANRIRLTPPHYAYLKISEGCNHTCSFCIIPQMRGKLRSRDIADVLDEAEQLVADGVQEVLLVAQDLSAYGVDLRYRTSDFQGQAIAARLYELCKHVGDIAPWVRLHYVYPYPHVDHIIPLMADGVILPYLDMPLQHASVDLLSAMRRPAAMEKTLERIHRWRNECPELVIRSTFIVGFPGETDEDVGMLLDFLREAQLDRVGCFTYSSVEGAAANDLPDHVDGSVMLDRQEMVYEVQAMVSAQRLQTRVGQALRVLIDEVDAQGHARGRSYADAPDIDGVVHVAADAQSRLQPGQFCWVQIDEADEHDLFGHCTGESVKLL